MKHHANKNRCRVTATDCETRLPLERPQAGPKSSPDRSQRRRSAQAAQIGNKLLILYIPPYYGGRIEGSDHLAIAWGGGPIWVTLMWLSVSGFDSLGSFSCRIRVWCTASVDVRLRSGTFGGYVYK